MLTRYLVRNSLRPPEPKFTRTRNSQPQINPSLPATATELLSPFQDAEMQPRFSPTPPTTRLRRLLLQGMSLSSMSVCIKNAPPSFTLTSPPALTN